MYVVYRAALKKSFVDVAVFVAILNRSKGAREYRTIGVY
jgi:hypothetical protein